MNGDPYHKTDKRKDKKKQGTPLQTQTKESDLCDPISNGFL